MERIVDASQATQLFDLKCFPKMVAVADSVLSVKIYEQLSLGRKSQIIYPISCFVKKSKANLIHEDGQRQDGELKRNIPYRHEIGRRTGYNKIYFHQLAFSCHAGYIILLEKEREKKGRSKSFLFTPWI